MREISLKTNFNGSVITNKSELHEFASRAKFPSLGLIVRKTDTDFLDIEKGVTNWRKLAKLYTHFNKLYGSMHVETDMRAMYNPSRMRVIKKAAIKLAQKINSFCPDCNTPRFAISAANQGLPCDLCHLTTRSTLSHLFCCQKCSYTKEEKYPNKNNSKILRIVTTVILKKIL